MRLGIVSGEFFDYDLGGVGGFGWAARSVGRLFAEHPELEIEPVYLSGRGLRSPPDALDGVPFVVRGEGPRRYLSALRRHRPDLLLAVDYRPGFWPVLAGLPRTPLLVWSRDPRGEDEWNALARLRLPHDEHTRPAGVERIGCRSMRLVAAAGRLLARPLAFASPAPELTARRAADAFGVSLDDMALLPNPIDDSPPAAQEDERPTVVFLGRLDPYKRPWLAVELGRRLPDVRFVLAGRSHAEGRRGWQPSDLPANVELAGHVGESDKRELLGRAWVLLNTSLHEGLPVSFLEALAAETPIVASLDPERVVSRFGTLVAPATGDGTAGLDSYEASLRELLADADRRRELGRLGRAWVTATHTPDRFVAGLRRAAAAMGVG